MSLWTENQRLVYADVHAHPNSNAEEIAARVGRSVRSVKGILTMTRSYLTADDAIPLHNEFGEFVGVSPMPVTDGRRWSADIAPVVGVDWQRVYDANGKRWGSRYRWSRHGDEKAYPQGVQPFYADSLSQSRHTAVPGYGICSPDDGAQHVCRRLGS
jgi:hypothetical protein